MTGAIASAEADQFSPIQPGGSLILAWQVKNKNVLVIGGGEVAAGRILACLNADARVTIICPPSGLNAEVAHRVATNQVRHIPRSFQPADLLPPSNSSPSEISLVLVAIDDPPAARSIYVRCRSLRIPVNVADVPPECDFFFGSVHRDGPLQIMVSTNGRGPRLAAQIRKRVAAGLPKNVGRAIDRVGLLRRKLRESVPDPTKGPARMAWMSRVSDGFSFKELCELEDSDMDNLLAFFDRGEVPSMNVIRTMRGDPEAVLDVWDGSFGFGLGWG